MQPQQAAAGHLRFDGSNRLVRDPAPKPYVTSLGARAPPSLTVAPALSSRSRLLERQPDARKISFDDSQSQPASPAPRASTAARPVPSPEAGRSARDSLGSPEPAATGTGEHFSPVAGPSNARLQHVEMEPFLEQDFGGGFDDVEDDETLVREKNPLFRASTGADEADDATFQGFEDDDLPPPRQAFGSGRGKGTEDGAPKKRQDKSKDKGKGKAREESPPTPPATDILARLGAWKASQRPTRDAHDGDNGTDARRSSGKSKKRSAVRASGSKPARSSPSDESTGRGGSDSDDSVDIPIPARQRSKGKKRAAAASSESDDDDDDEPPRKQSQTKHKRRARSPSPPLPLGAPGNNYFQGRNQPGGRVPWSTTETDLLIELLRQIGCNWARMMKLHGPTGERSKTFRQRTNVSLKDKAVGLAVSYLRRGAPLPAYLRTGACPRPRFLSLSLTVELSLTLRTPALSDDPEEQDAQGAAGTPARQRDGRGVGRRRGGRGVGSVHVLLLFYHVVPTRKEPRRDRLQAHFARLRHLQTPAPRELKSAVMRCCYETATTVQKWLCA